MLISWNITKACNLNCAHCYRDAGTKLPDELTTTEGKKLLADLRTLGFKIVIFSGGEPLLRPDVYELIAYASSLGLVSVLGTNGTLIDIDCAKALKKSGLKRAGISLDAVVPEIHDEFRQVKGSWDKAVAGIENCKLAGLEVQVHTTVTKKNISEVLSISKFAQKIQAKAHHIFFLVATGRGKQIDNIIPAADEYEILLEQLLERQKFTSFELKPVCAPQFMRIARQKNIPLRFQKGCLAGISYACILPDGQVHPCPYLPLNLGNIRVQGFVNIWQKNNVLNELRQLKLHGKCGYCEFKLVCSGCRAAAFYQSEGDYLAADLNCRYEPKRETDPNNITV